MESNAGGGIFGGGSSGIRARMHSIIKLGTGNSLNPESAEFNNASLSPGQNYANW